MEKELIYEDAIKELEEITNKLDSESLPLAKSEELFNRALFLAKFCQEELSKSSKNSSCPKRFWLKMMSIISIKLRIFYPRMICEILLARVFESKPKSSSTSCVLP